MNLPSKVTLAFACLFLLLTGAAASDIKPKPSNLTKGQPFTVYWYYWCVSGLDGSKLDCPFTHRVLGLKSPASDPENNGGHSHGPTGRPFVLNNGRLDHPADSAADPLVVESSTLATGEFVPIKHEMPEVSGTFQVEGVLRLPPNWFCWLGCFTPTSHRWLTNYEVALQEELIELPPAPDVYIRCAITGGCTVDSPSDQLHESRFHGKEALVQRLIGLAAVYRSVTGRELRITDMSLAKGGLLDIKSDWMTPHVSHRRGLNVDISRFYSDGSFINQELVDGVARDVRLASRTESTKDECPFASEGAPCLHLTVR